MAAPMFPTSSYGLLLLGWITGGLYLALLAVKIQLGLRALRLQPQGREQKGSVTLLQPILSGDPALRESLQHNLNTTPDTALFIWLIDEEDSLAAEVTRSIRESDPSLAGRIRILTCPAHPENANPKTYKLMLGFEQVTTEFVAVLDDDTRLEPEALDRARFALERADAYTGLPLYLPGLNLWSSLVSHFVNNNSVFAYLSLLGVAEPLSLNGMFYVMKTATLSDYGGFSAILHQIADDHAMARLIHKNGGSIVQGVQPQLIRTSVPDAASYVRLMHRWFVFANHQVRQQSPGTRLLLILILAIPPLLLWLSLGLWIAAFSPGAALSAMGLLWLRDQSTKRMLTAVMPGDITIRWHHSILAELLQVLHLGHALLCRRIRWRSRDLRMGPDGTWSEIPRRS